MRQAEVVAQNIVRSIEGEPLEDYEVMGTAAIHMSLGIVSCQRSMRRELLADISVAERERYLRQSGW